MTYGMVREKDGELALNPPHFLGRYFMNLDFYHLTREYYSGFIYDWGNVVQRKYGGIFRNPPQVIIFPTKVVHTYIRPDLRP